MNEGRVPLVLREVNVLLPSGQECRFYSIDICLKIERKLIGRVNKCGTAGMWKFDDVFRLANRVNRTNFICLEYFLKIGQ